MGEDVNQKDEQTQRAPLHMAALHLRETLMMILLKQQAYVDTKDINGHTALHVLATMDETNDLTVKRMMDAIVNFGANLDIQSNDGSTPLHLAAANKNVQTSKYLVSTSPTLCANLFFYF